MQAQTPKPRGHRPAIIGCRPEVAERGTDASVLGASADELRTFALDGLTRRLNIIGVPLDTL